MTVRSSFYGSQINDLLLADIIKEYWKKRGHVVNLTVEKVNLGATMTDHVRKPVYAIRSDMLNGKPR